MNEKCQILIIALLLEVSIGFFAYLWVNEIKDAFYVMVRYLHLAFACVLWILHFGSKTFTFTYKLKGEEDNRIIELPSVDNFKR